jgi:hypothetical protein
MQQPYAISPIQLTLFPLLASNYFDGLSASGKSSWKQTYEIRAAIVSGAVGVAGDPDTFNCEYSLQGKGPVANDPGVFAVEANGTINEQTGTYSEGSAKVSIAYDQAARIPVAIHDVRTRLPQTSVYKKESIQLRLTKDSQATSR